MLPVRQRKTRFRGRGNDLDTSMKEISRIDWDKLQTFKYLIDSGSATNTARLLGVSPSTVSRRIASLETALDLRLYYKSGNSISLTEEGAQIYRVASSMGEEASRLAAFTGQSNVTGTVSITCVSSLFSEVLASSLPDLLSRYPGIRINILSTDTNKRISSHEADIGIRLGRSRNDSLVSMRIGEIPYSVYSSPATPLDEDSLFNDELDWIAYNEEFMDTPEMRWMKRHMKRGSPVLRTTSGAGYAAAISAGIGVGILPTYRAGKFHPLHAVLQSRPVISRELWAVTLPFHTLANPTRVVLNWIKSRVGSMSVSSAQSTAAR